MEAHELGTFNITVKIKELALRRFRGIEEEMVIPFDKDLTVFIGLNGSGKSTILDATAGLLDDIACLLKGDDYNPADFFNYFDINNNQGEQGDAEIELGLEASFPSKLELRDSDGNLIGENWETVHNYGYRIRLNLTKQKHLSAGFRTYYEENGAQNLMRDALRELPLEWMSKSSDPSFDFATSMELPVLAYYPIRRLDEASNAEARLIDKSIFSNYFNQELAPDSFHFPTLKTWLGLQYLIKTQPRKKQNGDLHEGITYDTVIRAIKRCLNDDEQETFPDIFFEWSEDFPKGEMVIQKGETSLYYRQLSSGEQVLLAMVADLARQLAIANPRREDPLSGSGVVLIDEIDLHLHPSWQRKIVGQLWEIFPNVQFVVTTHSPIVLGNISSSHIRLVEENQVFEVDSTFGQDVSTIISRIMDTPSSFFSEKIREIHLLLAKNKLIQAEELIKKLEAEVREKEEDLPSGLLEVQAILERKKIVSL